MGRKQVRKGRLPNGLPTSPITPKVEFEKKSPHSSQTFFFHGFLSMHRAQYAWLGSSCGLISYGVMTLFEQFKDMLKKELTSGTGPEEMDRQVTEFITETFLSLYIVFDYRQCNSF